jgi:hypothetical protein
MLARDKKGGISRDSAQQSSENQLPMENERKLSTVTTLVALFYMTIFEFVTPADNKENRAQTKHRPSRNNVLGHE